MEKSKGYFRVDRLLKQTSTTVTTRKQIQADSIYDLTYEKDSDAMTAGISLLVVPIIIRLTGMLTFETLESYNSAVAILALVSLVIRIFVTLWIVNIANRQNRNSTSWGFFAFFFPSIALICIGFLRLISTTLRVV